MVAWVVVAIEGILVFYLLYKMIEAQHARELAVTVAARARNAEQDSAVREMEWKDRFDAAKKHTSDMDSCALLAEPFVKKWDSIGGSGQYKFAHAYADLVEKYPDIERWKIGKAIHDAVAAMRMK